MKKSLFLVPYIVGLLMLSGSSAHAQLKIRYINSSRILQDYPEAQKIQKQLDDLKKSYEAEFQAMQTRAQQQLEDMQRQNLSLSQEQRAEKETELAQTQAALEQYYYSKLGPQGEYFQKNQQLQEPLIDKINETIKMMGEREGYDLVLDVVSGAVVFGKEEYDVSDEVLEELGKSR